MSLPRADTLIPLTTIFTPPSQCTTDLWRISYDAQHFYELLGGQGYSSCLPASFTPTSEFFYSPGLYCPSGYNSACSSSQIVGDETATIVTCCPTGYSCQNRAPASGWPWEYTLGCTSACSSTYTRTLRDQSSLIDNICALSAGANAYSVQLRFRAADFATTTSTTSTTPSATPSSSSSLPILTSSPSTPVITNPMLPPKDTDLPTGAKAGIGVGAVLGVALVGAILFLAWIMRRNSKNNVAYSGFDQSELVQKPSVLYSPKDTSLGVPIGSHLPYAQDQIQSEPYELSGTR
ncbi:hypothetical protein BKA66DRAFT_472336 [Pyrenochaeta sp. MPI-SDFR-AT-0127]|nr:hypothetical protein BKA66DRAFT_472336 [Pyrenochaeta sp. MPI-SDFR-AT-0127]